jgi:hypothetical protein
MCRKWPQVRVQRVVERRQFRQACDISQRELEVSQNLRWRSRWVAEDNVSRVGYAGKHRITSLGGRQRSCPQGFASVLHTEGKIVALTIRCTIVLRPRYAYFLRGKALALVNSAGMAEQPGGIVLASAGILKQSVLGRPTSCRSARLPHRAATSISPATGCSSRRARLSDCAFQRWKEEFWTVNIAAGLPAPMLSKSLEALAFHQCLSSAVQAADQIRKAGLSTVPRVVRVPPVAIGGRSVLVGSFAYLPQERLQHDCWR